MVGSYPHQTPLFGWRRGLVPMERCSEIPGTREFDRCSVSRRWGSRLAPICCGEDSNLWLADPELSSTK